MGIEIGIDSPIPRIRPQLQTGLPTAGNNCAFEVAKGHIVWARHDGTNPGIRAMRNFLNVPTAGISILQTKDLYIHYGLDCKLVRTDDEIIAALADPTLVVHAAVQYGWINDNVSNISGDPRFRGGHAISLYSSEQVVDTGATWTLEGDPLHDARRITIPKGPIMVRIPAILGAMHAMPSGLQALIIKRK